MSFFSVDAPNLPQTLSKKKLNLQIPIHPIGPQVNTVAEFFKNHTAQKILLFFLKPSGFNSLTPKAASPAQHDKSPQKTIQRPVPGVATELSVARLLAPGRVRSLNLMKAKILPPLPPDFTPVSVEITFETQAELDAFGTLCNFVPVCDAFDKMAGGSDLLDIVLDAVEGAGAGVNKTNELGSLFFSHRNVVNGVEKHLKEQREQQ